MDSNVKKINDKNVIWYSDSIWAATLCSMQSKDWHRMESWPSCERSSKHERGPPAKREVLQAGERFSGSWEVLRQGRGPPARKDGFQAGERFSSQERGSQVVDRSSSQGRGSPSRGEVLCQGRDLPVRKEVLQSDYELLRQWIGRPTRKEVPV